MPNWVWYAGMCFLVACPFAYTLWRVRDRKLWAVYFNMAGLTYCAEAIVFIWFNSYIYRPHILAIEYYDSCLGAVISDAFILPMFSTIVAAFHLKWGWMAVLIGTLFAIETLFKHLGIYEHVWWTTIYTSIGMLVWFQIAKALYARLHYRVTKLLRLQLLFFTSWCLLGTFAFSILAFLGLYQYAAGFFADPAHDTIALASLLIPAISLVLSALVTFRVKWRWRLLAIGLGSLLDWWLLQRGILIMISRLILLFFPVNRLLVLAALEAIDRKLVCKR